MEQPSLDSFAIASGDAWETAAWFVRLRSDRCGNTVEADIILHE